MRGEARGKEGWGEKLARVGVRDDKEGRASRVSERKNEPAKELFGHEEGVELGG